MRPDFATCGARFINGSIASHSKYIYNSSVRGLNSTGPDLMTLEGCKQLCGTGTDYYSWQDSANTITTWMLPILGLLVQAPYESNEARKTTLALCRWAGSPIAALSYILWNIKVTGKAALMIDMATRYNEYPPRGSDFSLMRDSMYILCIMNQYTPKPTLPPIEAERLLRLAIFSNLLSLNGLDDDQDIVRRRTALAQNFREGRKKGVVPVFISFLWFVFALALSIQLAYGDIGGNETAHNLALGLLVGWLPILIMASTVDRNQVSADAIRERLNCLVEDVRQALINPEIVAAFMRATKSTDEDFTWCKCLSDEKVFGGDFFERFAGQGRSHWHYGVAHPILAGIETKFVANYGRDWLRHPAAARLAIVVGSRNINGLRFFDLRMVWQVTSSIFIVCGSIGGAFILSYFTPTVGLGCRSGGYLIYMVIALGLLVIEVLTWWLTHETTNTAVDPLARVRTKMSLRYSRSLPETCPPTDDSLGYQGCIDQLWPWFRSRSFRTFVRNFILRPGEIVNTAWLTYIIFAQTFGAYQTCTCMSSNWAHGRGGFIDFHTYDYYIGQGVFVYWGAATALSVTVMTAGLTYIVHEYCTQSHFSTENYSRAMKGLRWTRAWKRGTQWVRGCMGKILEWGKLVWWKIRGGKGRKGRRSLVWTKDTQLFRLSNLGFN